MELNNNAAAVAKLQTNISLRNDDHKTKNKNHKRWRREFYTNTILAPVRQYFRPAPYDFCLCFGSMRHVLLC